MLKIARICQGLLLTFALAATIATGPSFAQTASGGLDKEVAVTRAKVTELRDTFVNATLAAALKCAIATPTLIIEDVPSFGSYDPDSNTLKTSSWSQMTEDEQALFYKLLGPNATTAQARQEFEQGAHHWVLVHEMGHWWQACLGLADHGNHYAIEFGADRIAAAYWQERDPSIIAHQRRVFEAILKNWPDPVPAGQAADTYFDKNYDQLGPTPAYIWFQARMCITAFDEKPAPSFVEALQQTKSSN